MPKILCSAGTFTHKVAVEIPTIANLQFATFFGDGTLNARDGQNLVAGGSTFANIGAGPANQPNYATVTPGTNSLDTGMSDGYPAYTLVIAASPISGASSLLTFGSAGTAGAINFFNSVILVPGTVTNVLTFNTGVRPTFPTWHLYGIVLNVGSPGFIYDLTTGETFQSSGNVPASGSRPLAGTWQIGATTPVSGYTHPANVALAIGAQTGLDLTALNAIAAALRFPLAARGIIV